MNIKEKLMRIFVRRPAVPKPLPMSSLPGEDRRTSDLSSQVRELCKDIERAHEEKLSRTQELPVNAD